MSQKYFLDFSTDIISGKNTETAAQGNQWRLIKLKITCCIYETWVKARDSNADNCCNATTKRTLLSSVQLEIPLLFYGETPVTNALKKNLLHLCYINAMDPQYHYF